MKLADKVSLNQLNSNISNINCVNAEFNHYIVIENNDIINCKKRNGFDVKSMKNCTIEDKSSPIEFSYLSKSYSMTMDDRVEQREMVLNEYARDCDR